MHTSHALRLMIPILEKRHGGMHMPRSDTALMLQPMVLLTNRGYSNEPIPCAIIARNTSADFAAQHWHWPWVAFDMYTSSLDAKPPAAGIGLPTWIPWLVDSRS